MKVVLSICTSCKRIADYLWALDGGLCDNCLTATYKKEDVLAFFKLKNPGALVSNRILYFWRKLCY